MLLSADHERNAVLQLIMSRYYTLQTVRRTVFITVYDPAARLSQGRAVSDTLEAGALLSYPEA